MDDKDFNKHRAMWDREGSRGERQKDLTETYMENAKKIWGTKNANVMSDADKKALGVTTKKRLTLEGL